MKKQMQNQKGFTLIELMIVVAIIGILAAVALPAYSDYTKRAKMSEVMVFASAAKTTVSECLISEGATTDCDEEEEAGLDTGISSEYVASITVGTGAAITITVQNLDSTINGQSVIMTPTVDSVDGVSWACTVSSTLLSKYVPSSCRGT